MLKNACAILPVAALTVVALGAAVQPDPPPLQAAAGITAISGMVVDPDGNGLADVRISDNTQTTRSGPDGRFLLAPVPPNASVIRIDGRHAGVADLVDYGFYEVRALATAGQTTPLGYKVWLTPIDHAHDVTIPSPTTSEVIIQTPLIPGFEVHIPPGVIVRDVEGKVVTKIGITPLPIDRLPFPVPQHFRLPTFFSIQPGAACLYTPNGGIGTAQVRYPNFNHDLPKARATLWRYEPDAHGWNPYGTGTVSSDQSQVIPDPGVTISDFGSAECDASTRSVMDHPTRMRPSATNR